MKHKLSSTILFVFIYHSYYSQTWKTVGKGIGMDNYVYALLADTSTNTLITAGYFNKGDVVPASDLMSWDGNDFLPIPGLVSNTQSPTSMLVDTVKNLLYLTGSNIPIKVWNGSTWTDLGSGYSSSGYQLCIYKGELYVAGHGGSLTKWNGTSFVGVGLTNHPQGGFADLVVFKGDLYACGAFWQFSDGTPVKGIVKFDGNLWHSVGFTASGISYGNKMVATDSILYYSDNNTISTYDGTSWKTISPNMNVREMECYKGNLYVIDVWLHNKLTMWDGTSWSLVDPNFSDKISALTIHKGKLYVAGQNIQPSTVTAFVTGWDGVSWTPKSEGISGSASTAVECMIEYDCKLILAGAISGTEGVKTDYIAKYDGNNWSPLGTGANGTVYALAKMNGNIYVGGTFSTIGNVSASKIAVWNGTNYSALGTGIDNSGRVYALAEYNGELYVGGDFQGAGGASTAYIAKWNGSSWSAVGVGLDERVYALTVYNGELYAGGAFSASGDGLQVLDGIAKWNGNAWFPVAGGTDGEVKALCVHNNALYIGGNFSIPGENIAKWDGTTLTTLGTGANSDVMALASINGDLYVGGQFFLAGGISNCKRIARWNGTNWFGLSTGMNNSVKAIAEYNNNVFVGGFFTQTYTNQAMSYIAEWKSNFQTPVAGFTNCFGNICEKGCVIFSDATLNSPSTFQWSFPGGNPSTSTVANPHVCYNSAGTYSVTLIVSNANGADTSVQNITIFPLPAIPTITPIGSILSSSSATGNQWYLNGGLINGANNQTYTPTADGYYTVVVSNPFGCTSTSTPVYGLSVGINSNSFNDTLTIFPNPTNGIVKINFAREGENLIEICNELGQLVYSKKLNNCQNNCSETIDMRLFKQGVYSFRMISGGNIQKKKVVLIK